MFQLTSELIACLPMPCLATFHAQGAIAVIQLFQAMRDPKGAQRRAEFADQGEDRLLAVGVQQGCWLIKQEKLSATDQRRSNCESLFLATTEAVDRTLGKASQAHLLQSCIDESALKGLMLGAMKSKFTAATR